MIEHAMVFKSHERQIDDGRLQLYVMFENAKYFESNEQQFDDDRP